MWCSCIFFIFVFGLSFRFSLVSLLSYARFVRFGLFLSSIAYRICCLTKAMLIMDFSLSCTLISINTITIFIFIFLSSLTINRNYLSPTLSIIQLHIQSSYSIFKPLPLFLLAFFYNPPNAYCYLLLFFPHFINIGLKFCSVTVNIILMIPLSINIYVWIIVISIIYCLACFMSAIIIESMKDLFVEDEMAYFEVFMSKCRFFIRKCSF